MREARRQFLGQAMPATYILEPQQHQGKKPGDDQEKLQHLVVDGAGQPSQQDVGEHHRSRGYNAHVKNP